MVKNDIFLVKLLIAQMPLFSTGANILTDGSFLQLSVDTAALYICF